MRKACFAFALVCALLICSCTPSVPDEVSRDEQAVNELISEIGVSNETRLVVKKPHDDAICCNVYLVYQTENEVITEYTYEFYDNYGEYQKAVEYYSAKSVKALYQTVKTDAAASMVCVKNVTATFDSLDTLKNKFGDRHYQSQGYEIIE